MKNTSILPGLFLAILPTASIGGEIAAPDERPVTPYVSLTICNKDIRRARTNVQRFEWAREAASQILRRCRQWLDMEDDQIRLLTPKPGEAYAYGISGCPACGARWLRWGEGICDFNLPRAVTCHQCKHRFGQEKPGEKYFDDGKGSVLDGRGYFVRGVWNAWLIDRYEDAAGVLAYGYALTGDEKYAHKCAVILDALATLRPTSNGSADVNPRKPGDTSYGYFHHQGNLANQAALGLASAFDLVGRSESMKAPSWTNPTNFGKNQGYTVFDNILWNLLDVYERDLDTLVLHNLQNHETVAVAMQMALARLRKNEPAMRFCTEALWVFIENTFDRQGEQYEVAGGYSSVGPAYTRTLAELVRACGQARRDGLPDTPDLSDMPFRLDAFDSSRLVLSMSRGRYSLDAAGRMPAFGDTKARDVQPLLTGSEWDPTRFSFQEQLFAFASRPDIKESTLRNIFAIPKEMRVRSVWSSSWSLFHSDVDFEQLASAHPAARTPIPSGLLSGRQMVFLRSGDEPHRRCLMIRGGPNFNHANDDTLGVLLYDKGYELNAELGYGIYGRPAHTGWAAKTIAHNLVAVDEDAGAPFLKIGPGAEVRAFVPGKPFQFCEMSAPWVFADKGATEYRRAVVLADIDERSSYFVDVFFVTGGSTHDCSVHFQGSPEYNPHGFSVVGASPTAVPGAWTLAGLNPKHRNEPWDKEGYSWGENLLSGSEVRNRTNGKIMTSFSPPPPGNGYGFIYNVKQAETKSPWSATWRVMDKAGTSVTYHALNSDGEQVVTGLAPDILNKQRFDWVVRRRRGQNLSSTFAAVIEAWQGKPRVVSVERLPLEPATTRAVALRIKLDTGDADTIVLGARPDETVHAPSAGLTLRGERGFVRQRAGGKPTLLLSGGTRLTAGNATLNCDAPAVVGKVLDVDYQGHRLLTDLSAEQIKKQMLLIGPVGPSGYARWSTYLPVLVEAEPGKGAWIGFGEVDFSWGIGKVARIGENNVVTSAYPNPFAAARGTSTRLLNGKLLKASRTDFQTTIVETPSTTDLKLANADGLKVGDRFTVYDVKVGDTIRVPMAVTGPSRDNKTSPAVQMSGEECTKPRGQ